MQHNSASDQQLIDLYVQSNDQVAFSEIYARYGHLVLGLCLKYLKNRDDAKDATLNIFGKLLDDLKKHRISTFKSWLYVYSKNFCLMELRKRQTKLKKELDLEENTILRMDFSDITHLDEKERQLQHLENALLQLNDEQRQCVELFYLRDRSYKEVSEITGFDMHAVKSHIQNGKRNLKLLMEQQNK